MAVKTLIRDFWRACHLRSDDVLVGSFPKSGNTWVRFIFANIVAQREMGDIDVDFHVVNSKLLYSYDNYSYSRISPKTMPRFVKTHLKYKRLLFNGNRSVYVYRNPADVMVSYFIFSKALKGVKTYNGDFQSFIRDSRKGLPAWVAHYKSWIGKASCVLSYEELKENACSEMGRVFRELSIAVEEDELRKAVEESDIANVRVREEKTGRPMEMVDFQEGYIFARKGTVEQYRTYFVDEDYDYLFSLLEEANLDDILSFYQQQLECT
jgi:estrone sulfotransferase